VPKDGPVGDANAGGNGLRGETAKSALGDHVQRGISYLTAANLGLFVFLRRGANSGGRVAARPAIVNRPQASSLYRLFEDHFERGLRQRPLDLMQSLWFFAARTHGTYLVQSLIRG
jgi:hypothetical protein